MPVYFCKCVCASVHTCVYACMRVRLYCTIPFLIFAWAFFSHPNCCLRHNCMCRTNLPCGNICPQAGQVCSEADRSFFSHGLSIPSPSQLLAGLRGSASNSAVSVTCQVSQMASLALEFFVLCFARLPQVWATSQTRTSSFSRWTYFVSSARSAGMGFFRFLVASESFAAAFIDTLSLNSTVSLRSLSTLKAKVLAEAFLTPLPTHVFFKDSFILLANCFVCDFLAEPRSLAAAAAAAQSRVLSGVSFVLFSPNIMSVGTTSLRGALCILIWKA